MAKQIKKYMAVTTASLMVMQLAACGNSDSQAIEGKNDPVNTTTTPGNNYPATNDEDLLNVHNSEMADACEEWQESDDGSFECLDENSPYYAQHFFNGLMYATAGAMIGSAIYKSKNLKNGTDREKDSSGSAGAASTTTKKANGLTTGSSSSSSTGASSSGGNIDLNKSTSNSSTSNSNATTTSGANANSSNTNSYSSGQRSYSNGSSSSSNSYSSSSSTGKSGFGSGGASRGGSSSS